MSYPTKIATCCYCGTRAALVLSSGQRHELACASCGAPLHEMKKLRCDSAPQWPARRVADHGPKSVRSAPKPVKRKSKPRKRTMSHMLEKVFDVLEDIFD